MQTMAYPAGDRIFQITSAFLTLKCLDEIMQRYVNSIRTQNWSHVHPCGGLSRIKNNIKSLKETCIHQKLIFMKENI